VNVKECYGRFSISSIEGRPQRWSGNRFALRRRMKMMPDTHKPATDVMVVPPCPECLIADHVTPLDIQGARHVRYYRCTDCGAVWVTTPDGTPIT
jgi:hypothetical protein